MAKNKLPPLDFDLSGSATIRFFGIISNVGIHYVDASIPILRMICPNTISDKSTCKFCEAQKTEPAPRMLAMGWDCEKFRWCLHMAPESIFYAVMQKSKEAGVTPEMMKTGLGPDIIFQRIGSNTEVIVIAETIGQSRGSGEQPIFDDCLEAAANQSIWNKFENNEAAISFHARKTKINKTWRRLV